MRALVTNDDGLSSPGIRALAGVAVDAGLELVVAAPSWDSSGSSASLTAVQEEGRLLVHPEQLDGLPDVPAFGVEAAPAFIVAAAMGGAFGPEPEIVLSGINHGPNTGHSVLHSGTVGAALTASTLGTSAMAVSLDASRPTHLATATAVAGEALQWLLEHPEPAVVLNVNVPDVSPEELAGIQPARLCRFGAVQTNVTERGAGYVHVEWDPVEEEAEEGTDAALMAQGWATVTAIGPVCEAAGVDVADLRREGSLVST